MENASKALLIAGSVLIAILLLTLFSYLFTKMSEDSSRIVDAIEQNNKLEFNQQFLTYDKIQNRLDYMEDYLHYKLKVNVGFVYNRALLKRNINMRFVSDFDFSICCFAASII